MAAAGRILANSAGIIGWTASSIEACYLTARPACAFRVARSLNFASPCSSVFVTGIRGATPPPTG
jgi:hypothetical protein